MTARRRRRTASGRKRAMKAVMKKNVSIAEERTPTRQVLDVGQE
jgi:hypothetical protein